MAINIVTDVHYSMSIGTVIYSFLLQIHSMWTYSGK